MKQHIIYIFSLLAIILSGCKNDGYVKIDSLSRIGTTCFQGEKVPVWVCVNTDDLAGTTYKWECDGGQFAEMPEGISLYQNIWIAPMEMGTYHITCTVECNGEKDIRTTEILVDRYMDIKFSQKTDASYFKSTTTKNQVVTLRIPDENNKTVQENFLEVRGTKGNSWCTISTFSQDDKNRKAPFEFSSDILRGRYPNAPYPTYWAFMFKRPTVNGELVDKYIREIRFEAYINYNPTKPGAKQIPSVTTDEVLNFNSYAVWYEEYDARFGTSRWVKMGGKWDGQYFLVFEKKNMATVNLSVEKDLTVKVQGKNGLVLESGLIREWFEQHQEITPELLLEDVQLGVWHTNHFVYIDNWKLDLK